MARISVGIQLYSVREACAKDYRGTVTEIARMGYEGVELAGYGGLSPHEMKDFITGLGIQIAGSHHGLDELRQNLDGVIAMSKEAGCPRIICPYLPQEFQDKGEEGYREAGKILNEIGAKIVQAGLSLSYHNHNFEFKPASKGMMLDVLFAAAEPKNLKAELDCYWVQHGGESPVAYIHKYAERIELLHIKDMAADEKKSFTEIGNGILDWDGIFKASSNAGVEWYLVEQDVCPGPELDSVRKSIDYLKSKKILG